LKVGSELPEGGLEFHAAGYDIPMRRGGRTVEVDR